MQNFSKKLDTDEIDLSELLIILWAHKIFLTCICILGIFIGATYASTLEKLFTASATYIIRDSDDMNTKASAFSSLAGIGLNGKIVSLPTDQVMGREFIMALDKKVDLKNDLFFNTYNPNAKVPTWKAELKKILGFENIILDQKEAIWQRIVKIFLKNVSLEGTDEGAIKIYVSHHNASRAALITNAIMEAIIENKRNETEVSLNGKLKYMAESLASSLTEVQDVTDKLTEFTLNNNGIALESFALEAFELSTLRENITQTKKLHSALAELASLLNQGATTDSDYLSLRKIHPIVDNVEFRRVLGQNEIINSWTWPKYSSVIEIFDTLSDRLNRLESEILVAQLEAKEAGLLTDEYANLVRDRTVAEATYQVLIEQVKAHSFMAGYMPNNSKIYEYAAAPLYPSAPNRKIYILLGAILGLFIGCALATLFAYNRSVFYSKKSLLSLANAKVFISAKHLGNFRQQSLENTANLLTKHSRNTLRNLAVRIHQSGKLKLIILTSSNTKLSAIDISKALAMYMQSASLKIGIVNFSEKPRKKVTLDDNESNNSFTLVDEFNLVSILRPNNKLGPIEELIDPSFETKLISLQTKFDLVFLCADDAEGISLAGVLNGQEVVHITAARIKRTKFRALAQLCKTLPIQGLLYE
jgi:uncharacterized protein involved in exopolysaccharide biosynthesis